MVVYNIYCYGNKVGLKMDWTFKDAEFSTEWKTLAIIIHDWLRECLELGYFGLVEKFLKQTYIRQKYKVNTSWETRDQELLVPYGKWPWEHG